MGNIPPPPPPPPAEEPVLPPAAPVDTIGSKDLDALNREAPLAPVFFALDSFEISAEGRAILQNTAQMMRQQSTWQVTVEGHCDERGTAEYNISLGERRAVAAKTYLVSLGVAAERLRTVSYGKEFPFDPGHDESAWAKNRRAHFVITAK
jgi:peptidoglycan-associated lipoprotein